MSDTPKYSQVRISEAVRRQLKEEARRRAQERAARRAAEAARRRAERFRRDRVDFKERVDKLRRELAEFEGTPASRHVAESLRQLQSRLAGFADSSIADEKSLGRAEKELYLVQRELTQIVAHAKAAQDAQELDQEAAIVLRWKYQAAEDRRISRRFDPEGLARFEEALRKVEAQLERRDLAGARRAMTAVGRQFDLHRAEVQKQEALWFTRKQAAETALVSLQEKLAGLQSDPAVQRWQSLAVVAIAERANELTSWMERGQFEQIKKETERLAAEAERILKAAEERQARQQEEDYKTECTVRALQACGFMIDGTTQSQEGNNIETMIHAHRIDGRALAVNVPQEGAMRWSVDGFPMHVVSGSNGQPANVCDEAVEQIEAIQDVLNNDYGIETSELTWTGHDPERPKKTGKSLRRRTNCQQTREARSR